MSARTTDKQLALILSRDRRAILKRLLEGADVKPTAMRTARRRGGRFLDAFAAALDGGNWDGFWTEFGPQEGQPRLPDAITRGIQLVVAAVLPSVMPDQELVLRLFEVVNGLAERVNQRYEMELTRQSEELAELVELKSTFLRLTSHELRRPVGLVRGYVSMLEDGSFGEVPAKHKPVLAQVSLHVGQMSKLIDDLTVTARLEAGGQVLTLSRYPMELLLKEALEAVRAEAEAKGMAMVTRVRTPAQLRLEVDAEKVRVALVNLLSNAIKFAPKATTVEIELRGAEGRPVTIEVSDEGPGLEPAEAARVFERYYRTPKSVSRGIPGSGLGLFIVKQIAELHGGSVRVASRPGRGSTFSLELPA
jgi:signal transduction histidine kinase